MAKLDFSAILSQQVGSAPEPKAIPEGTYHGELIGLPANRVANTKEGEKPVLAFTIGLMEPGDDVDTGELEAAGGLLSNSGEPKRVRKDFWPTDDSRYQLDRFLESLGVTGSYEEALPQTTGRAVTVFVTLDEYTTKGGDTRQINNIQRLFAREE